MERKCENRNQIFAGIVTDNGGRIVGRYESRGRELLDSQLKIVRGFLLRVSKQTKGVSIMGSEQINMCFIAGEIKNIKAREDSVFMLVDVGSKSKFLPCVTRDKELLGKASKFEAGDYVKVVGYVRGWSQKKNEQWENHVDICITEIRNDPPVRAAKMTQKNQTSAADYPF